MECAGDSGGRKWGQSPIDIDERNLIKIKFPALIMSGHWNNDGEAKMRNIGTTVRVTLEGNRSPATIQGGPLATDIYELSEVVFRWGSSNCKGAEHTLNGTWFTMEAQAIHFNKRYETIERCWHENDGLAICSYFLQAYQVPTWDEHPSFSKITDDLYKITQYNSYTKIPIVWAGWDKLAKHLVITVTWARSPLSRITNALPGLFSRNQSEFRRIKRICFAWYVTKRAAA